MKNKKKYLIVITAIFCLLFSITLLANGNIHQITAYINNNLKLKVNGENFIPTDEDGTALTPILYNDRTYLPVRALGNALDTYVDWEESTQTVIIGGISGINKNNPIDLYYDELMKYAYTTYEISYAQDIYLEAWKNELENLINICKEKYTYDEDKQYLDDYYKSIENLALSQAQITALAYTDTTVSPEYRTYGTAMGYSSKANMASVYRNGFNNLILSIDPISNEFVDTYEYIFETPKG